MLPALCLSAALIMSPYAAPNATLDKVRSQKLDDSIMDAYHAKEQSVGSMEGSWRLSDLTGKPLLQIELRAPKTPGGDIEGAWRSLVTKLGINRSGFIAHVTQTGDNMEINYFVGHARSPVILHLQRVSDVVWQGDMLDVDGARTPVKLERLRIAS